MSFSLSYKVHLLILHIFNWMSPLLLVTTNHSLPFKVFVNHHIQSATFSLSLSLSLSLKFFPQFFHCFVRLCESTYFCRGVQETIETIGCGSGVQSLMFCLICMLNEQCYIHKNFIFGTCWYGKFEVIFIWIHY